MKNLLKDTVAVVSIFTATAVGFAVTPALGQGLPGRGTMAMQILKSGSDVQGYWVARHQGHKDNMLYMGVGTGGKYVCSLFANFHSGNWTFVCRDGDGDHWLVQQGTGFELMGMYPPGVDH